MKIVATLTTTNIKSNTQTKEKVLYKLDNHSNNNNYFIAVVLELFK